MAVVRFKMFSHRRFLMLLCLLSQSPMMLLADVINAAVPSSSLASSKVQIITVIEPPASYINSHGELSGYATDLVRSLQRQVKDDTDIQIMPESRALLTATRAPNVLLFGFSRTLDREQKYHWIMPLLRKRWVIYVYKNNPLQLKHLDELRSLESIGVVRGDVREEWLKAQGFTNLQSSASHAQNLARLKTGRLQAIAYEPQGMQYLLKEMGLPLDEFRPALHFHSSEVWLMMSRQSPTHQVLRWQLAAEQLKLNGQQQIITERWQQRLWQTEQILSTVQQDVLLF